MENNGITPVMTVGGSDCMGGGSFTWIFGLLVLLGLMNGGFGGFGGNAAAALGYENLATSAEVQRGFDAQNSAANEREILAAVTAGTAQSVAATNQSFHDLLGALSDKYSELARDIANATMMEQQAIANQNQCCCDTKMLIAETGANIGAGIAQNRYEAAMNTAAINANTTAQTQRILDAMAQDKIEALQAQVNALKMDNALATVVRYPSNTFYAVPSPCFGTGGCPCVA